MCVLRVNCVVSFFWIENHVAGNFFCLKRASLLKLCALPYILRLNSTAPSHSRVLIIKEIWIAVSNLKNLDFYAIPMARRVLLLLLWFVSHIDTIEHYSVVKTKVNSSKRNRKAYWQILNNLTWLAVINLYYIKPWTASYIGPGSREIHFWDKLIMIFWVQF